MSELSVFQYQSARDYLRDQFATLKQTDAGFSARKFCRQTDFGSHALLVMIMRGKRKLTLKQVPALVKGFRLNSEERIYLQTLIQLDNAKSEEEKNFCKLWLNDINPRKDYRILEIEQYHLIADWIHMAILTLAKIPGLKISAESVYSLIDPKLTQNKLTLPQVRQAIERLLDLGLLREDGDSLTPTQNSVRTKDDVSSRGAREYHRQVARLGIEALEAQKPDEREFQSFALTIPQGKIPLAKDMIRKFRHQMVQVMESEPGSDVYQCNLQFFRLTESPLSSLQTQATEDESHRAMSKDKHINIKRKDL